MVQVGRVWDKINKLGWVQIKSKREIKYNQNVVLDLMKLNI